MGQRFTYDEFEGDPGIDLWIEQSTIGPDHIDVVIDYGSDDNPAALGGVRGGDTSTAALQDRLSLTLAEVEWIAKMAPRLLSESALTDGPEK